MQKIVSRNVLLGYAFILTIKYIQKHHNPNHRTFGEIQDEFLKEAHALVIADRIEKEKANKKAFSELKSKGKSK